MDKKKLFLWSLYDFANSIVFINFLVYFSQWLVLDGGLSDFWYNATFAIATILLFFSAPILAAYTDKHGGRKIFLNISTVGLFMSYGLAVVFAYIGTHIFVITLFFLLGQYFYQLAFIFYNPMIQEVSSLSWRARASGIGQFSNAFGQVVGLAIMLPLSGSRLGPLIPSLVIFFILALPMMIFYKEEKYSEKNIVRTVLKGEMSGYWRKLVPFFSISIATPMLFAFFFYNDALVTVTNNYAIYIQRVFAVPDSTKSLLLMAIVVMNAIGGILSGWIGDKIGILKTLKITLISWIVALPIMAIAPNITVYMVITVIVGILIGSMWATSRAYVSTLLSKEDMGYGFSFYTLLERFSTLVGPLTWGGIILFMGTESHVYRIAMASMTVFVIIGLAILIFWKRKPVVN
jgi:MFS transporter, UMF1 family